MLYSACALLCSHLSVALCSALPAWLWSPGSSLLGLLLFFLLRSRAQWHSELCHWPPCPFLPSHAQILIRSRRKAASRKMRILPLLVAAPPVLLCSSPCPCAPLTISVLGCSRCCWHSRNSNYHLSSAKGVLWKSFIYFSDWILSWAWLGQGFFLLTWQIPDIFLQTPCFPLLSGFLFFIRLERDHNLPF